MKCLPVMHHTIEHMRRVMKSKQAGWKAKNRFGFDTPRNITICKYTCGRKPMGTNDWQST